VFKLTLLNIETLVLFTCISPIIWGYAVCMAWESSRRHIV